MNVDTTRYTLIYYHSAVFYKTISKVLNTSVQLILALSTLVFGEYLVKRHTYIYLQELIIA